MSTRYVWKKYYAITLEETHIRETNHARNDGWHIENVGKYDAFISSGYSINGNEFSTVDPSLPRSLYSSSDNLGSYSHFIINGEFTWNGTTYSAVCLTPAAGSPYKWGSGAWHHVVDDTYYCVIYENSTKDDKALNAITLRRSAGSLISIISAGSSGTYPSNGEENGYWYIFQGRDSIDPTAVSYSEDKAKGGKPITVTITPAVNTYGGTITYRYQYQADGGAWTDIGSETTETSVTVTVPQGTKTFRVRVQASDDSEFTSTDYVTGATLAAQNIVADIGVANKAHATNKWLFGVNDKAREIVSAYIGVGGKAKKLF